MTSENMFVYGKPMTYSPLCTFLILLHADIFLCLAFFCDQIKILHIEYFQGDYIHRY